MHLYEQGNGLFGTHVSCYDVIDTLAVLSAGKSKPKVIGEPKCLGELNGFASRIVLLHLDWNGAVDAYLPRQIVLKIPTMLQHMEAMQQINKEGNVDADAEKENLRRMEHVYKQIHNVEVDFYARIAFINKPNLKCYGGEKFTEKNPSKAYLLLEYSPGLMAVHSSDSIGEHTMEQVIASLAALHSLSDLYSLAEKEHRVEFFGDVCRMLRPEMQGGLISILHGFTKDDELIEQVTKAVTKMSTPEYIIYLNSLPEMLGMERVPIHADVWHCNMLFTRGATDQPELRALIDFQTIHNGNAGCELARAFCTMLSPEDRRDKAQYYLRKYYSMLLEETNGFLPFSLVQLEESLKGCLPVAAYLAACNKAALIDLLLIRKPEAQRAGIRNDVLEDVKSLLLQTITVLNDE